MKEPKRILRIALAGVLLAVALAACRQGPAPVEPQALAQEAQVTRGTVAEVVQAAGQVVALNARMLTFGTARGRVQEVLVRTGQTVQKGQALVRIDTSGQERQLREAKADLKVAEATLADAQRVATAAEAARAEADLAAAEAELALANVKLAAAQAAGLAPLEAAVADAEAALQLARDQLRQQELTAGQATIRNLEYNQAFHQRAIRDARSEEERARLQAALAEIERDLADARGSRESALTAARDQVAEKEEALRKAQAALARARAGEEDPTAAARLAREQAAAKVEKAKKALDEIKAGQDSASVKAAKTAYEAALAKVESAQAAIANSTMKAPFDGVVWMVFVRPDDWVEPNTNVIYLADPKELRVRAQATEMEVVHLSVGQKVRLTFDAYPGKVFAGEVLSLPVRGNASGGVSIYQIETTLEQPGEEIRAGMLANVRFVVGEKADVLTIPAAAVQYRANNETYVTVRGADGKARDQAVTIGLNDGIVAEVVSGLSEGQTVLVPLVPPTEPRLMGPGGMMGPVAVPAPVRK